MSGTDRWGPDAGAHGPPGAPGAPGAPAPHGAPPDWTPPPPPPPPGLGAPSRAGSGRSRPTAGIVGYRRTAITVTALVFVTGFVGLAVVAALAKQPPKTTGVVADIPATAIATPAPAPTSLPSTTTTSTSTTSAPPTTVAPTTAPTPPPTPPPAPEPVPAAPRPAPTKAPAPAGASFKNCTEARAAGPTPIYRGQAGYARHLDSDNDGVACE